MGTIRWDLPGKAYIFLIRWGNNDITVLWDLFKLYKSIKKWSCYKLSAVAKLFSWSIGSQALAEVVVLCMHSVKST